MCFCLEAITSHVQVILIFLSECCRLSIQIHEARHVDFRIDTKLQITRALTASTDVFELIHPKHAALLVRVL